MVRHHGYRDDSVAGLSHHLLTMKLHITVRLDYLFFLLLGGLLSFVFCSCTPPTGPTAPPLEEPKALLTTLNMNAMEQELVYREYADVVRCVGQVSRSGHITVSKEENLVNCSEKRDALNGSMGCTFYGEVIETFIWEPYFPSRPPYYPVHHELIHAVLALRNEDVGHNNPAFSRCSK